MNRCLSDIFGYCRGEPKAVNLQKNYGIYNSGGRWEPLIVNVPDCKKDAKVCPLFLTHTQLTPKTTKHRNSSKERVTERKRGRRR